MRRNRVKKLEEKKQAQEIKGIKIIVIKSEKDNEEAEKYAQLGYRVIMITNNGK